MSDYVARSSKSKCLFRPAFSRSSKREAMSMSWNAGSKREMWSDVANFDFPGIGIET